MATTPPLDPLARGYRRALLLAATIGLVSLTGLAVTGYPIVGGLVCIGLLLGAWNSQLVHRSIPLLTADDGIDRRAISFGGLRRLGYVTFVVVLLALALKPIGWTVAIGLVIFQVLLLATTSAPLLREVRKG